MTIRPVTPAQVRALADEVQTKLPHRHAMLVRAVPVWDGAPELALTKGVARVVAATSPLAVREALGGRTDSELLVVLTDVADRELGADVLARVAKERVLVPQSWALVRSRLALSGLDPQLAHEAWMADALLQYEPPSGWPPPTSGFLTSDQAWTLLCEHWLRLRPDGQLRSIVEWIARAGAIDSLLQSPEPIRLGAIAHLQRSHPPAASIALAVATSGRPGEVLPLGLAARAVFAPAQRNDLMEARVRFAIDVGQHSVDDIVARDWATAAEAIVAEILTEKGRGFVDMWLERAEQLVEKFGAHEVVGESEFLSSGLEQRYERAARLAGDSQTGDPVAFASLDAAVMAVEDHALAALEPDRLEALRSAERLGRRLAAPSPAPIETFPAAVTLHRRDSSWCDRARRAVRRGDRNIAVATVYTSLLAATDAAREHENERFARLLVQWSAGEPGESSALVPIESVLATVVAPLAATAPVLLVVLDGMSWAVATELLASISAQGWLTLQPRGGQVPTAVATLPTVTAASRASLLCGRLTTGDATVEKAGFAILPALSALHGGAPVLFHKGELTTADGAALGSAVRTAIADGNRRVVGVVVNAIDDHLTRGDQVRVHWELDTVTPLRELLTEAAAVGRTVVLTSDHGHVLEERGRTVYRQIADASERWRPSPPPAEATEVLVRGPRVVMNGGEVVMPWTETLRYGTPKHGYHGGATPQEVLVPLIVVARATAIPEDWERTEEEAPGWWRGSAAAPVRTLEPLAPPSAKLRATGQTGLFDEAGPQAPVVGRPAWIDALLASPAFAARRPLVSRAQVDDNRVADVLAGLDRRGGSLLREALSTEIGVPVFRIDGLVQSLRRLLNVEGYAVIELDGETVRLHRAVLRTQFEVND